MIIAARSIIKMPGWNAYQNEFLLSAYVWFPVPVYVYVCVFQGVLSGNIL